MFSSSLKESITWLPIFLTFIIYFVIYLFCVCECFAYVYICVLHSMQCPQRHCIPWDCSYRQLWTRNWTWVCWNSSQCHLSQPVYIKRSSICYIYLVLNSYCLSVGDINPKFIIYMLYKIVTPYTIWLSILWVTVLPVALPPEGHFVWLGWTPWESYNILLDLL